MMSTTDIRNKVIDQLMAIKDAEFLRALSDMIDLDGEGFCLSLKELLLNEISKNYR